MAQRRAAALIGLPTLVTIGVKSIIQAGSETSVNAYHSFGDFRSCGDVADVFIVTAEEFVGNLDFFMPRRQRTLLYGNFDTASVCEGRRNIGMFDDEAVVEEKINSLLESLIDENEEKGELSGREKEVLRLLVEGKINKEIADELCISVNTVITHRKNISAKTGIKSVSGLSIYALMNGIT